ncbi:hypothetical protein ALC56_11346 [Trachymyrmex septentrionalis]|uniref:Uncharacterized protein n=1 Tax=Trachymyrmex septentrionalis TaxID=34720 RepID=A0A195F2C6_9HYME|nr:hypothetical protein ALC56_11346 [Trachymyrmex septentrionalis]
METVSDVKDIAKLIPLPITIPSKQEVVHMSHTPSSTHSQSKLPLCPAYRFCRELREPYRSPMLDRDHQQITILHDLLQAIKEAALKLIQLITIEEQWREGVDPRIRYSGQYERSTQPHNPESGLIASTSSSVCVLCGVALHLKNSSENPRQFDRGSSDNYSHGISSKQLENILKKIYIIPLPAEKDKNSDDSSNPGSILDYILSKENNINRTKGREKVFSKIQSTDMSESGLQPKLLFIQQKSSGRIAPQTRQDESQRSKLEELGLHLHSRKIKVHGDTVKVKKTKMQKLEKDANVKRWIEEVVQLRLQMQIEELHKSIKFFKQENEYIRRLAKKCRCLSEDIQNLQQMLPIREIHSVPEFTTTVKHLQAKYHNHGIIATLTGMFQGSINIQQITAKLLTSFKEHWNPRENIATTHVSSASEAQAPLKPSSMVFNVY